MGIDREPPIDLCRVLGAASINLLMFIASNPVQADDVTDSINAVPIFWAAG